MAFASRTAPTLTASLIDGEAGTAISARRFCRPGQASSNERSAGMIKTQYISNGGRSPMANVVKKHSISSELAQKMVDQAVAKARVLGVTENVAILDDGGNLKAFSRMDGAPILSIEMAQNKAWVTNRGTWRRGARTACAGSIVNLSSTMGHRGAPGASVYTASKHAVEGLTKSSALEGAA